MEELLKIDEVTKILNVTRQTVYNLIKKKEKPLPVVRIGKNVRFSPSAIKKWLEEQNIPYTE